MEAAIDAYWNRDLVTLDKSNSKLTFVAHHGETHEIKDLVVKSDSVLEFYPGEQQAITFLRLHKLDISDGSMLIIEGGPVYLEVGYISKEALGRVLVRTKDGLRKSRWREDFAYYVLDRNNTDPWNGAPEPATYGVVLAGVACGLVLYRKRRKNGANVGYLHLRS